MKKVSLTISGLVVLIIGIIFDKNGVPVVQENIENFVAVSAQIIGVAGVYYGRYRKGDINIAGVRK
jgi:hypothetical protein